MISKIILPTNHSARIFFRLPMRFRCHLLLAGFVLGVPLTSLGQVRDPKDPNPPRAPSSSQQTYTLREILSLLENIYQVRFLYEDSLVQGKAVPRTEFRANDFFQDLKLALRHSALTYETVGNRTIVIVPKKNAVLTGSIHGVIVDESGAALPFAQVVSADLSFGARANAAGEYVIESAPIGVCKVQARMLGHRSKTVALVVRPGEMVQQNFALPHDALNMQGVVVTGTRNPQTKLESSVAITTANAAQMRLRAPRSAADLLQVIPGFYVESSGGEGGNNLFARGIPADGSFRYVTLLEDGLPVFEAPELAFVNADELFRLDETLGELEAMRGSTGAIFASNAPAGMINFISKTGELTPSGTITTKLGEHGLFRTDVNFGGAFAQKWRYNLGGFYRYDQGVRAPGFAANRGGQMKANLTRWLRRGYVRLYTKYLDDRNIFYLPVPLQNPDAPQGIAGFDPNFGTLTTSDARFITVPAPAGKAHEFDLSEGVHPVVRALGAEVLLELGEGWTLKNSARAMSAELQFNAIFSIYNPIAATHFAQTLMRRTIAATNFRYRYTHFPHEVFDPSNANGNGLVVESGWWAVAKPLKNFTNHLQLTKQLSHHALTAGLYFSDYSADEFWYWQNILLEVRDRPRLLDLTLLDANGAPLVSVTQNGFTQYGAVYVNSHNNGVVAAYYLNDEWQISEALRLEGGLRYEHNTLSGRRENHATFDLGDSTTLADDHVSYGNGTFRAYDFSYDKIAFSVGGNYRLNTSLAFYGRGSKGFRMPDFDQFRAVNAMEDSVLEKGEVERVLQFEGGLKLSTPRFALFGALFYSGLQRLQFDDEVLDPLSGQITIARRFANSTTMGLEMEATFAAAAGWGIEVIATLQKPRLHDFSFTADGVQQDFDGNQVRRIPQVFAEFKPYFKRAGAQVFANVRYVGARFADDANEVTLPAFAELHAGAAYSFPRLTLSLHAANLTNALGLTEGNPRIGQVIGVRQNIYLARPILGRALTFATAYSF